MKHLISIAVFLGLCVLISPLGFLLANGADISPRAAGAFLPMPAFVAGLIWHFLIARNVIYPRFEEGRFISNTLDADTENSLFPPPEEQAELPMQVGKRKRLDHG